MLGRLLSKLHARFFPKVSTYHITPKALAAMQALAEEIHPKEAFGVLRGRTKRGVVVINEVAFQPFENTSYTALAHIDPSLTRIVGTFHSHPSPDARPSRADKRLFGRDGGLHCIGAFPYEEIHAYNSSGSLLGVHKVSTNNKK